MSLVSKVVETGALALLIAGCAAPLKVSTVEQAQPQASASRHLSELIRLRSDQPGAEVALRAFVTTTYLPDADVSLREGRLSRGADALVPGSRR